MKPDISLSGAVPKHVKKKKKKEGRRECSGSESDLITFRNVMNNCHLNASENYKTKECQINYSVPLFIE